MVDGSTWSRTITLVISDFATLTQQGGRYTLTGLESRILYSIEVEGANKYGSRKSNVVSETTISGESIVL